PQLAAIVLDRFASDSEAIDPAREMYRYVQERLGDEQQRLAIGRYCLAMVLNTSDKLGSARAEVAATDCAEEVRSLLRHQAVQLPLAAGAVVSAICAGSRSELTEKIPAPLIEQIGILWREQAADSAALQSLLNTQNPLTEPMAASVAYAIDPTWRPR